jgi:hypothetical protein
MGINDLNKKIEDIKMEMASLTTEMDVAISVCVDAVKKYLPLYYENCVKGAVLSDPERTEVLGTEGIGRIKYDLRILIDDTPNLVDKHINYDDLWPHRRANSRLVDPVKFFDELNNMQHYVEDIVKRYGFNSYACEVIDSEEIRKSLEMYYVKKRKADSLKDEIDKIEKEKKIIKAKNLWSNT